MNWNTLWRRIMGFFYQPEPSAPSPAPSVPPTQQAAQSQPSLPPAPPPPPPTHPNVIEALLGGSTSRVEQGEDGGTAPPPYYNEGFYLPGSGNPKRNTLDPGDYVFTFTLPEGKAGYQVDVYGIPGTLDGWVEIWGDTIPRISMDVRNAVVMSGATRPGVVSFHVYTPIRNSFGVVVYF